MNQHENIQRRSFLMKAGLFSTGAVAGGAIPSILQPQQAHGQTGDDPLAWPFPFVGLDPDVAAQRGYDGFYQGACCYGTVKGILSQWQELLGEPFTSIPADMFKYGEGGVAGWGTLCGTLNGAAAMINLVCAMDPARALINELMAWYSSTAVPVFIPAGKEPIAQSTSESPLCHVSVGKWCQLAQVTATSNERKERCARLVADVAKKTCTLLNNQFLNQFAAEHSVSSVTTNCMACHGSSGMNTALGKMQCTPCHTVHAFAPISDWQNL